MVRAEILIRPERQPHVRLEPASVEATELLQLLLCYGAKLRWCLNDQPEWVRQGFEQLTWQAAVLWDTGYEGWPADWVPVGLAGALLGCYETSVPRHERYIVQLYSDERGRGYPCGSPPPNPRRDNLVVHYLALLEAVAARLDDEERAATQPALLEWWQAMFRAPELPEDASLGDHVAVANRIVAGAGVADARALVTA